MEPIILLLALYLPSSFGLFLFSLNIWGIEYNRKQVILLTVLYALAIYSVRSLFKVIDLPFGFHTLVLLLVGTILLRFILKSAFVLSFGLILSGVVANMVSEFIAIMILASADISLKFILENTFWHFVLGLITIVPLFGVGLILNLKKEKVGILQLFEEKQS